MLVTNSTHLNHVVNSETLKSDHSSPMEATTEIPEPVSDHLFLNNIRPEQAREFLLSHINRKLEVSESNPSRGIADYIGNANSSEETSNQIAISIRRALSTSSADLPNQAERIASITNEVNDGFTEARQIFTNLNSLRSEFLNDFESIQKNVNKFLNTLTSNFENKVIDKAES